MAGLVGGGDSDGNPKGRDYRLGGEAMTARAGTASPESGSVKEEAVTPEMIKAGCNALAENLQVTSDVDAKLVVEIYLAMRQADPRTAELEAALEKARPYVTANASRQSRMPAHHIGADVLAEIDAALNRKDKP